MRIDSRVNPPYLVDISATAPAKKAAQTPASAGKGVDRVEISAQSRELAKLKNDLAALPDVRQDRVALARQQMQYGPYRVDPLALAHKMLENAGMTRGDDHEAADSAAG